MISLHNHKNSDIAQKIYELNTLVKQKILWEIFDLEIDFNHEKFNIYSDNDDYDNEKISDFKNKNTNKNLEIQTKLEKEKIFNNKLNKNLSNQIDLKLQNDSKYNFDYDKKSFKNNKLEAIKIVKIDNLKKEILSGLLENNINKEKKITNTLNNKNIDTRNKIKYNLLNSNEKSVLKNFNNESNNNLYSKFFNKSSDKFERENILNPETFKNYKQREKNKPNNLKNLIMLDNKKLSKDFSNENNDLCINTINNNSESCLNLDSSEISNRETRNRNYEFNLNQKNGTKEKINEEKVKKQSSFISRKSIADSKKKSKIYFK